MEHEYINLLGQVFIGAGFVFALIVAIAFIWISTQPDQEEKKAEEHFRKVFERRHPIVYPETEHPSASETISESLDFANKAIQMGKASRSRSFRYEQLKPCVCGIGGKCPWKIKKGNECIFEERENEKKPL